MDLEAIRNHLPGLVREAFGERVSLCPMRSGEMRATEDTSRGRQVDVAARFDILPALEQLGGGRERPGLAWAAGEVATATFETAALTWIPGEGDLFIRAPEKGGAQYRITRSGPLDDRRTVIWLSRSAA